MIIFKWRENKNQDNKEQLPNTLKGTKYNYSRMEVSDCFCESKWVITGFQSEVP